MPYLSAIRRGILVLEPFARLLPHVDMPSALISARALFKVA
jgi:hypothetical protein